MELVQVERKNVTGLNIRTKNADEMNPGTARIAGLWESFYAQIGPKLKEGASVFGVYYDYESDAYGEFSVLAGSDGLEGASSGGLVQATIHQGKYLLFKAKGEMPQVVLDTWAKVWDFFSAGNQEYQRAYTTDFELYKSPREIEIYIAVK